MTDTNTYQAQANELSQKLWAIANDLRGQMDASEFKNYILGVIFYRYLSERTEMYMIDLLWDTNPIRHLTGCLMICVCRIHGLARQWQTVRK